MNHLDLFSGIGGFSLAAQWSGIETIAFCEKDPFCQKVLKKHWPAVPCHNDIKTLKGFPVDMITAGFPCQPFSVAGKKKGIDDDRYLWPDTMRIIRESKPDWIILENVSGIISHLDPILKDLESEKYNWFAFLIPASALGAPHKRERLWIIAHRDCERSNNWIDTGEKRSIQDDWNRHVKEIQSKWPQFQPESWKTFNAQDWLTSSNATSERPQRARPFGQSMHSTPGGNGQADNVIDDSIDTIFGWQKDQPPIPGVDDGLPNGLERNKALGNSIVPQIPYLFMRMILAIEDSKR